MQSKTTLEDAIKQIQNHTIILKTELIAIQDSINRYTSCNIIASINNPLFNNSAMDGVGITLETLNLIKNNPNTVLKIIKTVLAGDDLSQNSDIKLAENECIHIMTGASLPNNICAVVMIEHTKTIDENTLCILNIPDINSNIRPIGDDYRKDDILVPKGKKLNANDIAIIASSGIHQVNVYKKPKVAMFTTGKETIYPQETLTNGKIYNSNLYLLSNFFLSYGFEIIINKNIPDDIQELETCVNTAISQNVDIIVSAGAVSMGTEDIVKSYLIQNSEIMYKSVKIRPGKPNMLGLINNKILYFGLPGNPVSCAIGLHIFVKEYINCAHQLSTQMPTKALLTQDIHKKEGFTIFIRGQLHINEQAIQCVNPVTKQGSHMLKGLQLSNCLIQTPIDSSSIKAGSIVDVYLMN